MRWATAACCGRPRSTSTAFPTSPTRTGIRCTRVAQDLELSINFHVGVGNTAEEIEQAMNRESYDPAANAARSTMSFVGNVRTLSTLLTCGLLDRFPRSNFVSVESGFGYLPFLLDSLDWQWRNSGAGERYPERLLPSEYFFRQVYGTFWFEEAALPLLPRYQDNVMFETDFPHPRACTRGPAVTPRCPLTSFAATPRSSARTSCGRCSTTTRRASTTWTDEEKRMSEPTADPRRGVRVFRASEAREMHDTPMMRKPQIDDAAREALPEFSAAGGTFGIVLFGDPEHPDDGGMSLVRTWFAPELRAAASLTQRRLPVLRRRR